MRPRARAPKKPTAGAAAPAAGALPVAPAFVGLAQVLAISKDVAGQPIDTDAPLMESGIDSLGAVELKNKLAAAVGADVALPGTLVFDHPTARRPRR
eukprot:4260096-Prymnesium_polylepis.1